MNGLSLRTADKRGSAETIWASIGRGTQSLASRISTPIECASERVPPEAELEDEEEGNCDYDDEEEEELDYTNQGKEQAADTDHGDTIQSEVSMANMWDMLEEQRKLVESHFQNTETKLKDPTSSKPMDKVKVTYTECYCGGVRQLETFLGSLRWIIWSHNHRFPGGDTDKVQYALDYLGS